MHHLIGKFVQSINIKYFYVCPPGSGFSSSLGSGGHGRGERVAVIAGSVGGVLLVLLLLAGYCYCFPGGAAKRNRQRRQENQGVAVVADDEQHKNGNRAVPLVNGGSLVVTSASRGSVLLNVGGGAHGGNDNSSPPLRRHEGNNAGANGIADGRDSPQLNEEFPRALEPQLRNADADDSQNRRTLSMSIPDVTRVEPHVGSSNMLTELTQPQFFTLGRNATRNNSNSSSPSSRHSFHDRAGPSNSSPLHDSMKELQQMRGLGAQALCFGTALGNRQQQPPLSQEQPKQQQHYAKPQQPYDPRRASQVSGGSNSNGNPFNGAVYRSHDDSDVGSLYRDGSIGGDSLSESLLCDDRTNSPPPPAPSGPPVGDGTTRSSPYTPLNRRSLAML